MYGSMARMNTHNVNARAADDPLWCRIRTCQYPAVVVLKVAVEVTYHRGTVGEAEYWTERREDWAVCDHHRKVAGTRVRGSRGVRRQVDIICGCESSFCDHANPVEFQANGAPIPVEPVGSCGRVPTGAVTMDWVGEVCEYCADNIEASGGGGYIHRSKAEALIIADLGGPANVAAIIDRSLGR